MKKIWIAIAAAFGVLATAQFSQAAGGLGGTVTPATSLPGPEAISSDGPQHRYGLMPWLRKGIWWKQDAGGCAGCGAGSLLGGGISHGGGASTAMPGAGVPGYPQPGQPGMGMPGTLVFPQHPFVRSPRDFLMWEK